eukprot:2333992-Pleurochrysis_carterae.AAC.1
MSSSCQCSASAAFRSACRSSYRRPGNAVARVERVTGTQRAGSAQSHMTPLAHGCIVSYPSTTVGTCGTSTSAPPALALRAATALSASRIHASTLSSYTGGRNSWWIAMSLCGPSCPSAPSSSRTVRAPSATQLRGSRRRAPCHQ